MCGYLKSSECLFAPVFRTLPPLLVDRTDDDKVGALIASTVREIVALVDAAMPGSQMMLGRLMELLFVEILQATRCTPAGPTATGWLAALNDPVVGRALQLVHAAPARRWTAEDLAREAGSSRTVLAERFNALLGKPPIEYVTSWRIQLAADRLRGSPESIANIAADVGLGLGSGIQSRVQTRDRCGPPGRWRSGQWDNDGVSLLSSPLTFLSCPRRRGPIRRSQAIWRGVYNKSFGGYGSPPLRGRRRGRISATSHSFRRSVALPPAAAVLIVTVCSVAKRRR